ncbi:TPA: GIY-YIG nuclease family protein [Vibrio parahaemolyticus]
MMNRLIKLTDERLTKAKTPKGGYCKAQLQVLGIDWPAPKGWKKDITGTKVTLRRFIAFVKASKNKLYLDEIESLLPTLNPPVIDLTKDTTVIEPPPTLKKGKLSKKEIKRESTAIKRAQQQADREARIRAFGIQKSIQLVIHKANKSLRPDEIRFFNSLKSQDEYTIDSQNIRHLYNVMKKYGIILAYRPNGSVTPSGFTKISSTWKAQFLYVIRDTVSNDCKIGVSKNPKSRKLALQTSNPNRLKISLVYKTNKNAVTLERSLHKFFRKRRKHGEWFKNLSDEEITRCIGNRGQITTEY